MTSIQEINESAKNDPTAVSFAEFLQASPPNERRLIFDLSTFAFPLGKNHQVNSISTPDLLIHCDSEKCNGLRYFRSPQRLDEHVLSSGGADHVLVRYFCSNCSSSIKVFGLAIELKQHGARPAYCTKFGEIPQFGPPTPGRLMSMMGPDCGEFLKGRRSENLGLGVGAFTYYRRVVENQKSRILDEVIKVAKKSGSDQATIDQLERAKNEWQFSKSIDDIKDAIPKSLFIDAHNPMTLLHNALSEGLHGKSDDECLHLATSVRVVLAELAERVGSALRDEDELKQALSTLLNRNQKKPGE